MQGLKIPGEPIVGRFLVDGWAIVSEKNPEQHLNGHARAVVQPSGRTDLQLPTDDEVTGGTFVQWFRLGEGRDPDRERPVAVPDLARMTRARAERVLAESGLVLGETVEESSEVVRRNSVVRTEPAAGKERVRRFGRRPRHLDRPWVMSRGRSAATRPVGVGVRTALASPRRPLDADTRASMAARLGHDFGTVLVYTRTRRPRAPRRT